MSLKMTSIKALQLVKKQFPQWSHLPVKESIQQGRDNWIFRLGATMLLRFPRTAGHASQVAREQKWLPFLCPHLKTQISKPIAQGSPSNLYPWHWSVYEWIEGSSLSSQSKLVDKKPIALALGKFLTELHACPTSGAPLASASNYWRGYHPSIYTKETVRQLTQLGNFVDKVRLLELWKVACSSHWKKPPVWVHGDLSPENILLKESVFQAVIDFGALAVGDPACDLTPFWTIFNDNEESQLIFKEVVNLDDETWSRARGWLIWKTSYDLLQENNLSTEKACTLLKLLERIAKSNTP